MTLHYDVYTEVSHFEGNHRHGEHGVVAPCVCQETMLSDVTFDRSKPRPFPALGFPLLFNRVTEVRRHGLG